MEAVHLAAADPAAQAAPTGARHAVAALSAGLAGLEGPRTPLKPSGETPNAPQNQPDFWEVSAMVRGQTGLRARAHRLQGGPGHPADGPVQREGAGATRGGASGCTKSVNQIK